MISYKLLFRYCLNTILSKICARYGISFGDILEYAPDIQNKVMDADNI